VRHDDDRVLLDEFEHQLLDPARGDRVERRAGLVHEDHVGLDRERPRDAEALLLAARHAEGVLLEAVLHLVPQRAAAQRALDDLVHRALHAEHAGPEGDVVVDRLGEGVRLLEDHPDPLAHLHRVDPRAVEILAVEEHPAVDRRARDEVVHAVERAQQRGLAAARRADERGDAVRVDLHVDVAHGGLAAVGDRHVLEAEHGSFLAWPPTVLVPRGGGRVRGAEAAVGRLGALARRVGRALFPGWVGHRLAHYCTYHFLS
jgi:hypothetical protein